MYINDFQQGTPKFIVDSYSLDISGNHEGTEYLKEAAEILVACEQILKAV